jgi:glutamate/aspartate transport system substrate-binding protein
MIARAVFAAALLLASAAAAQEGEALTGTLLRIRDRGVIRLGVRDAAVPFAFRNRGGQPIGFSVDICHGIAEDAAAALNRDLLEPDAPAWQSGIRIAYVPVAADERLGMVQAHAIDLECGSTTATEERAKSVAFSPTFFVAGTKLAVPAGSPVSNWRDLAGKTVAVSAGTTNEAVLQRLAGTITPPLLVQPMPSVDAAFDAAASGKAGAVASDDVLLAGIIASRPADARFRIVGDYLSFEPYAIMLAKDDPPFLALVRASFTRQAEAGTLRALYQRWFTEPLPTGGNMALPMSAQLSELFRALGQPD